MANRGEIACRIISTARLLGIGSLHSKVSFSVLGIPSVAVFSSADQSCRHVTMADEASCIGPPPAIDSYLNTAAILKAAKNHGATAIHPGYGFLSEDHKFASQCAEAGITFIGPTASVIRLMGDKSAAKQIMRDANVPVVPGYDGTDQDLDYLMHKGDELVGYPLLVKATMGGGGKGMKLATSKDSLKVSHSLIQSISV